MSAIADTPILAVSGRFVEEPESISTNRKVYEWIQDEWELGSTAKAVAGIFAAVVFSLALFLFGWIPIWDREVDSNPDLLNIEAVGSVAEAVLSKNGLSQRIKNYAANPTDPNEVKEIQKLLFDRCAGCETAEQISDLLDETRKTIEANAGKESKMVSGKLKLIRNAIFDEIISEEFFNEVALQHQEALYRDLAEQIENGETSVAFKGYKEGVREAVSFHLFKEEAANIFIARPLCKRFQEEIQTDDPFEDWERLKKCLRQLSRDLKLAQIPEKTVKTILKDSLALMQGQFVRYIVRQKGPASDWIKELIRLDVIIEKDAIFFSQAIESKRAVIGASASRRVPLEHP